MHFSKTFAQLLLDLPPELRENAIQYRQLKKLINQVVVELSELGLNPKLLHELMVVEGEGMGDGSVPSSPAKEGGGRLGQHVALGNDIDDGSSTTDEIAGQKELRGDEKDVKDKAIAITASLPDARSSPDPSVALDGASESIGNLPAEGAHTFGDNESLVSEDSREGSEVAHDQTHDDHPHFKSPRPKAVYEFNDYSGGIEPRLRLWLPVPEAEQPVPEAVATDADSLVHESVEETPETVVSPASLSLLWALQRGSKTEELSNFISSQRPEASAEYREIVIPLASDTAFFHTLSTALDALSKHLTVVHDEFVKTLQELARTIGETARPVSSTSPSFRPHSGLTSHAGSIPTGSRVDARKSDLYSWREIFQLYVETEVFESVSEVSRGELSVEESEKRLRMFVDRITQRGLGDSRKLKLKNSRDALETFLQLNLFILNVKKFQYANSEATRKILKKHTKRTALPFALIPNSTPGKAKPDLSNYALVLNKHASNTTPTTAINWLPKAFVQAIGETLLPVIPHLDDYSCLICTNIAYKPIRLNCGHMFCVRCLVKMQKRSKANCPMCRAPNVLIANQSNVDWALLNFMQDWFPEETKEKVKANEKEIMQEELIEMGLDPNSRCIIA